MEAEARVCCSMISSWTSEKASQKTAYPERRCIGNGDTSDASGRTNYKVDFYPQTLPRVRFGHTPTFTHGDFQRKIVVVRLTLSKPSLENDVRFF